MPVDTDDQMLTLHREELVNSLKKRKIIISKNVFDVMVMVPRHEFLPPSLWDYAYLDSPQKIAHGQTISAPHMNAMMCEYLELEKGLKVLEIGTGSGYHAALLSRLVGDEGIVYTIERHKDLVQQAQKVFSHLGYKNIHVILADGSKGLEEYGPFDRILVTAASPKIPRPLLTQLSPNDGILCIPVGNKQWNQDLLVIHRAGDTYQKRKMCGVLFVPLIGENGFPED